MNGNALVTLNLVHALLTCVSVARRCKWVIDEATVGDVARGHRGWSSSRCRNRTGGMLQKTKSILRIYWTREEFSEQRESFSDAIGTPARMLRKRSGKTEQ